jgi:hypothetical protein
MNWRRGLWRVWIAASALWVIGLSPLIYQRWYEAGPYNLGTAEAECAYLPEPPSPEVLDPRNPFAEEATTVKTREDCIKERTPVYIKWRAEALAERVRVGSIRLAVVGGVPFLTLIAGFVVAWIARGFKPR